MPIKVQLQKELFETINKDCILFKLSHFDAKTNENWLIQKPIPMHRRKMVTFENLK